MLERVKNWFKDVVIEQVDKELGKWERKKTDKTFVEYVVGKRDFEFVFLIGFALFMIVISSIFVNVIFSLKGVSVDVVFPLLMSIIAWCGVYCGYFYREWAIDYAKSIESRMFKKTESESIAMPEASDYPSGKGYEDEG